MGIAEFDSVDLTQGPPHLAGWWRPLATEGSAWGQAKPKPPCDVTIPAAYVGKVTQPYWGCLQSPDGDVEFQLWYDGCYWDEAEFDARSTEPPAFMREQWTLNTLKAKPVGGGPEIVLFDEYQHGLWRLSGDPERLRGDGSASQRPPSGNGGKFEKFQWKGRDSFRVYLAFAFPTDFAAATTADTPLPLPQDDGVFRFDPPIAGKAEFSMAETRLAAFNFVWLCLEADDQRRCVLDWPF